jgi:hypothetical protein
MAIDGAASNCSWVGKCFDGCGFRSRLDIDVDNIVLIELLSWEQLIRQFSALLNLGVRLRGCLKHSWAGGVGVFISSEVFCDLRRCTRRCHQLQLPSCTVLE